MLKLCAGAGGDSAAGGMPDWHLAEASQPLAAANAADDHQGLRDAFLAELLQGLRGMPP